jgi:hypothetical protein
MLSLFLIDFHMHATPVLLSLINIDAMIEAGVTDNVFYHLRKLILSVLVIPGSCVWSFDTVVYISSHVKSRGLGSVRGICCLSRKVVPAGRYLHLHAL